MGMRTSCDGDGIDIETAEEQARIRRQLDRVLAHNSFRNSRRYQSFLRHVVEERLRGNGIHLKERMIGVSVFDQPLDYDTNANSVVRVTAGEVRKRLAQYYLMASLEDEILIGLPLGSYVPEFHVHEPSQELGKSQFGSHAEAISQPHELDKQKFLTVNETAYPPGSGLGKHKILITLVGCGLSAAAIVIAFALGGFRRNEADRIWKSASNGQEVLLSAGASGGSGRLSESVQTPIAEMHSNLGFSSTTTKAAASIGTAIGHAGGSAFLLSMQDTRFEDLQRSPVVLIGAFNNEWTLRLQSPLRYQFVHSPQEDGIVDTRNPSSGRLMVAKYLPYNQHTQDYGILAHFQSPMTGQSTTIAGGVEAHGTEAVREFLSDPQLLQRFSENAPRAWEKGNYEIVLATQLVGNLAAPPKVVDAYFW